MFTLVDPARRLLLQNERHNKFYEAKMTPNPSGGYVVVTHWGRVNQAGSYQTKRYANGSVAYQAIRTLMKKKLREGYKEVTDQYTVRDTTAGSPSSIIPALAATAMTHTTSTAEQSAIRPVGRKIVRD